MRDFCVFANPSRFRGEKPVLNRVLGQSTVEYAVLIAVVVGALIAMQIYMKRGVQGKLRSATDDIGEQFSPTAYKGHFRTVQQSATEETLHVGGQGKGETRSQTTTADNIEHIRSTRTSKEGTAEELTDAQSADRLFR